MSWCIGSIAYFRHLNIIVTLMVVMAGGIARGRTLQILNCKCMEVIIITIFIIDNVVVIIIMIIFT